MRSLIKKVLIIVGICVVSLSADEMVTIDSIKGKVSVPKNPKRIMVFDFAVLDTINALGIKDVKLGLPLKSLPVIYKNYEKSALDLGGIKEPNIEKVYSFKPDIIFINGRTAAAYKDLKSIAPTVQIQLDYKNYIESSKKLSTQLATIFGKEDFLVSKIAKIDEDVKHITNITKNSNKKTLIMLTNNGKISTYAAGSRFGFIYSNLGFNPVDKNIKASKHGQGINFEYISKMNPDTLLYIDRTLIGGGKNLGDKTLDNDLVLNTNAGKNNKIIALDSEVWYMMPGGIKAVSKQLDEIKKAIK